MRPMPFERLFSVIGDLLYGTILTNLLSGRPADPESQARDVADVILNGILSGRGATRSTRRGRSRETRITGRAPW